MHNKISLSDISQMNIGDLSNLSASQLTNLQNQASENLEKAKRLKDWIDGAINIKYQNDISALRQRQDKVTGSIHFYDGDYKVTSTIPKKVEWDQSKLKEAISQIKESGENPYQYVAASYKMSEAKYLGLPEHLREIISPARIFKVGKESLKISPANQDGGDNE